MVGQNYCVCKSILGKKIPQILNFEDVVKIWAKVCIVKILGMEVLGRKRQWRFYITGPKLPNALAYRLFK